MAESQLYSNAYVTFNSTVLAEAMSVRVNKNPNLNKIATLAKGFAGVNLGAAECEITIETAVPSADFEVNPDQFMTIGRQVEVGVVAAGRQMTAKMFISGSDFQGNVNSPTNLTISLMGPLAPWV